MQPTLIVVFLIITTSLDHVVSKSGVAHGYSNRNYIPLISQSRPMVSKQVSSKLKCLIGCMNVNDCSLVVYNKINTLCDMYNLFPLVEVELIPDDDSTVFVFNQTIELSPSVVNTSWLLSRLSTTNVKYTIPVAYARSIEMDIFGYLLTLEALNNITYVDRFDRTTLALVKRTPLPIPYTNSAILTYYNNMIFISAPTNITYVFDHVNFTWLANITCDPYFDQPRNIIFMESLQLMIITLSTGSKIVFFHINSPTNYTCFNAISLSGGVQSILKINDTFFQVTAYNSLSIYSFQYNGSAWIQSLFVNISQVIQSTYFRVAGFKLDNMQRRWVTLPYYGIAVFDQYGSFLGKWQVGNDSFDLSIMNDYRVVIASRSGPNLTLYDPQTHE